MRKITIVQFETDDGELFDFEQDAEMHELKLKFLKALSSNFINNFTPSHDFKDCNDNNLTNAGKCMRCTLLMALRDHEWFLRREVSFHFLVAEE